MIGFWFGFFCYCLCSIAKKADNEILLCQYHDVLLDMVYQHCSSLEEKDRFDSMAISADADAIRLLATSGDFVIERDIGRRVIAKRKAQC